MSYKFVFDKASLQYRGAYSPPWLLDIVLKYPRPGISDRSKFIQLDEGKSIETDGPLKPVSIRQNNVWSACDNHLFTERLEGTGHIDVKIRNLSRVDWSGLFQSAINIVSRGLAGDISNTEWYDVTDLLEAGAEISGIAHIIRQETDPILRGTVELKPEEKSKTIHLRTLKDWSNPLPDPQQEVGGRLNKAREEHGDPILKKHEKNGELNLEVINQE